MHVDHIRPVEFGGCDCPENLRAAHSTCNVRRTDDEGQRAPKHCDWFRDAMRVLDGLQADLAPAQNVLIEALERSEERGRQLERENGSLQEKNAALERVVEVVRQMSDAEQSRADRAEARLRDVEGRRWWEWWRR